jgi:cupin fold WbuC family metalloprotein
MGSLLKTISRITLDDLSREAAASLRRRRNLNLHEAYDDPCQRLFNAVEPGSYVRPHQHSDPHKPECLLAVRGRMALVVFDERGMIEEIVPFGDGCVVLAVEVPADNWHMVVAMVPGSVFFEAKAGPYLPRTDKVFAPWAPEEESCAAIKYLADIMTKVAEKCP